MFKKFIVTILTVALALSVFTFVAGAESFSAADALKILRFSVGSYELTEEEAAKYDANGDGKIDTLDALAVLRLSVGASSPTSDSPVTELVGKWKLDAITIEGETFTIEQLDEVILTYGDVAGMAEVVAEFKRLKGIIIEFKSGGTGRITFPPDDGDFTYTLDGKGAGVATDETGTGLPFDFNGNTGVLTLDFTELMGVNVILELIKA